MKRPPDLQTIFTPRAVAGVSFRLPSLAKQEFRDECDMAKLVARYNKTGSYYDPLTFAGKRPPMPIFDDFTEIPDFGAAQDLIADARARFDALPSATRAQFDNDPTLLLAFVSDPANRDKAVELGLLSPPAPPPPSPASPPPSPAPAPASS